MKKLLLLVLCIGLANQMNAGWRDWFSKPVEAEEEEFKDAVEEKFEDAQGPKGKGLLGDKYLDAKTQGFKRLPQTPLRSGIYHSTTPHAKAVAEVAHKKELNEAITAQAKKAGRKPLPDLPGEKEQREAKARRMAAKSALIAKKEGHEEQPVTRMITKPKDPREQAHITAMNMQIMAAAGAKKKGTPPPLPPKKSVTGSASKVRRGSPPPLPPRRQPAKEVGTQSKNVRAEIAALLAKRKAVSAK